MPLRIFVDVITYIIFIRIPSPKPASNTDLGYFITDTRGLSYWYELFQPLYLKKKENLRNSLFSALFPTEVTNVKPWFKVERGGSQEPEHQPEHVGKHYHFIQFYRYAFKNPNI